MWNDNTDFSERIKTDDTDKLKRELRLIYEHMHNGILRPRDNRLEFLQKAILLELELYRREDGGELAD